MSCTTSQISRLNTPGSFSSWYISNTRSLNIYAGQASTPSTTQQVDLAAIVDDITSMKSCLQSKVISTTNLPNTVYDSQKSVQDIQTQIAQEEANAAIARDRVAYIRNPEQNVSNYESWFPIDRPIHTFSLLIIMSMTVFLGTFLILILLSLMGVDVIFQAETSSYSRRSSWFSDQFTPTTIGLAIALIGVIIYFTQRK